MNFTKPKKKKRRPYTAIEGKVKHYQPDGTGRDIYAYSNHGGLTKGNRRFVKHSSKKYKEFLRDSNKKFPKVGVKVLLGVFIWVVSFFGLLILV